MLKVLFIICVILEAIMTPIFLKYYYLERNKTTFTLKTICTVIFLACGVLALKISGNNTLYAKYIMWGLVLGGAGDVFLHALTKKPYPFVLGCVSFLVGHIFYIMAYQRAIYTTYPGSHFFEWHEILAVVIAECLVFGYTFKNRKNLTKPYLVALASIYGAVLMAMMAKATRFVFGEIIYGTNDHMVMVFITVFIGAFLFFCSDVSLIFILKSETPIKRWMRIFNIGTYYAAQVLLASSMFFVFSRELVAVA